MKKSFFIIIMLLSTLVYHVQAQNITGKVFGVNATDTIGLPGAIIQWQDMPHATVSQADGSFEINYHHHLPHALVATFAGYQPASITIEDQSNSSRNFYLQEGSEIEGVLIEKRQKTSAIDPLSALNMTNINEKELLKAACCNLSESFETNASIDVNYADAVTGSKQITLLGLDGIYTQINWENMPLIRGLGEYYGLSTVPGTWLNSIQVGKGAGSVINGFESMAGQINIEFEKPDGENKFYINGYQSVDSRSELNANFSTDVGKGWSTALLTHANLSQRENDGNGDSFVDMPRGGQINLFNRWKYAGEGNIRAQFGVKYLHDQRTGGQQFFDKKLHLGGTDVYGFNVNTDRFESFAKVGLINPEKPYKSTGLILNYSKHNQDAFYGNRPLASEQNSFYANLINQTIIGSTLNTVRYGGNLQVDKIQEATYNTGFKQNSSIPGAFVEYNYNNSKNINLVLGLRGDYVNVTDEVLVSPRVHFKVNTDGENAVRLSAGRGFRAPTVFADNARVLATSRNFIFSDLPALEKSWNFGANLTRYFYIGGQDGTFTMDFYRTTFDEQLIADTYSNAQEVTFSRLDGKSYANSFQTEVNYTIAPRLDFRAAYKNDKVRQTYNGQEIEKALTPQHRGLVNIAYALPYDRWKFDITGQYVGEQRLPATALHPTALQTAVYSQDYFKLLSQVTARVKDWEIYVGGENLTNFKQENPIIGANNPFGPEFDSGSVWGPIVGANVYAGFRYKLKK